MADVPLYVAIITAGASVISGSIPLVVGWARDAGREKRAAEERRARQRSELERKKREQCVELLRLTRTFRVLVESTYGVNSSDLGGRAEEVRRAAGGIAIQADEVEFLVPGVDTEVRALAAAASDLVSAAEEKRREHGAPLAPGDFSEFDQCLGTFKKAAREALGVLPARRD